MDRPDQLRAAREAAVRLLKHRLRGTAEIRHRLLAAGHDPDLVDEVVAALEQAGLLDDQAFAAAYVRDGLNLHGRLRRRLADGLRELGVAGEVAERVLDRELPAEREEELARRLATTRADRLRGKAADQARRKLTDYLLRQGAPPALARSLAAELTRDWPQPAR